MKPRVEYEAVERARVAMETAMASLKKAEKKERREALAKFKEASAVYRTMLNGRYNLW